MSEKRRFPAVPAPQDEASSALDQAGGEPAVPRKAEKAFVIHAQLIEGRNRMRGRIEHVVSGRTVQFSDLDDLVEFVRRVSG